MEHFLINSSVCLFSLWLVYKLLLENVSWHYFKRFYLLGSLVISAVIPFLVVRTVTIPLPQTTPLVFPELEVMETTTATTGFEFEWSSVLLLVYVIGVLIMAFRFIKNLYALRIKSTDEIRGYEAYTLVLRKLIEVPHSFLTRIYASITDFKSGAIPDSVLQHEKAHLDQKHSLDILAIEVLLILMWFNPLLYLIKYSIKLNHEFLADQAVLSNGIDTKTYQETLLAYSSNSQNRVLANTFNFPIIKKRFTIMKTRTSNTSLLLRTIAVLPVLAVLVISCGQEEIVVEPEVMEIVEEPAIVKRLDPKIIVIKRGEKQGSATLYDGTKYSFKRKADGSIQFFDDKNQEWNYQKEGYKVEEVDIIEETIIEVPITLISSEPSTLLEFIEKNKTNLVYYKDGKKITETEAIKNIEVFGQSGVEIGRDENGKRAIKIKMNQARWSKMPPPPPPAPANSPTQAKQITDGTLKIYINDKIATPAQLDNLAKLKPADWKNIAVYPKEKNGVRSTYFYGEGL
ncbi:M56 family metallopeptidase [Nonlabens sp. Ci31]|uniref:M56 family metallopeptidase n=1 Tax=Nonlabens sp. Ci31 TaxID=2608253 RepID=UPI001463F6B9|nr:M56 family metallopeptidase [Nonlabens sp. Ci31]QJP34191.1 M56 family metallopeptidase [Nonlabens sp. Ci31]